VKISVIVPFYNSRNTIKACAEALLGQSYPAENYEIIMVDNNSTDGSADIVKFFPRICLLSEPEQGAYASRNRGIEIAKGSIIAFTDSDCVPSRDWLRTIDTLMTSSGDRHVLLGSRQAATRLRILEMLMVYENTKDEFVFGNKIQALYYGHTNNMAVRRDMFEQIGCFKKRNRGADSIFVRQVADRFGCTAIHFSHRMEVRHLEMNTLSIYFQKVFIYAQSRHFYKNIVYIRPLSIKERIQVFRRIKRKQGYSTVESIYLLLILSVGFLFWNMGSFSAFMSKRKDVVQL
jgi:glycosyltransferase involved in cell wall biosynthesis